MVCVFFAYIHKNTAPLDPGYCRTSCHILTEHQPLQSKSSDFFSVRARLSKTLSASRTGQLVIQYPLQGTVAWYWVTSCPAASTSHLWPYLVELLSTTSAASGPSSRAKAAHTPGPRHGQGWTPCFRNPSLTTHSGCSGGPGVQLS